MLSIWSICKVVLAARFSVQEKLQKLRRSCLSKILNNIRRYQKMMPRCSFLPTFNFRLQANSATTVSKKSLIHLKALRFHMSGQHTYIDQQHAAQSCTRSNSSHIFLTSLLMMQVLETKYNHTHTLTYTVFELLLCIVGLNVRSAERKKKKKKTEKTLIPRLSCQSNTPTRTAL